MAPNRSSPPPTSTERVTAEPRLATDKLQITEPVNGATLVAGQPFTVTVVPPVRQCVDTLTITSILVDDFQLTLSTVIEESFTPNDDFAKTHPDQQAAQYLRLMVSDNGLGISPSTLPRIFDPYFSTNKKEDGTGMGLAIVHGIVTQMRGTIEVSSELNVGTIFKVFLPIAENIPIQREPPANTEIIHGSESILLVDD